MHTQAQQQQSIRMWSGILKVAWVNLWLWDNFKLAVEYSVLQIKAHNGHLPPKKKVSSVKFTWELYEAYLANFDKIDGFGTLGTVTSTPVSPTWEVLSWWTIWKPIKIANKNGDNTIVTGITVKKDWVALLVSDFNTYVADGSNWDEGYTYIVPVTSQTWTAFTVDYTYTPNAKRTYTIKDIIKALQYYDLVFENVDENGKKFTIKILKWYSIANMELAFVADDNTEDVMKIPFEFTASPDENNNYIVIEDEQAVA